MSTISPAERRFSGENSLLQRLGKIARVRVWGSHLTSQIRQKSGWCQTQVSQLTAVLLLPSDETAVGTWPSSLRPTDSIGSHGGEAFYDAAFRFIGAWAIVYLCNRICDVGMACVPSLDHPFPLTRQIQAQATYTEARSDRIETVRRYLPTGTGHMYANNTTPAALRNLWQLS